MGCGSSKKASEVNATNAVRIQIVPQENIPSEDVLFTKSTLVSYTPSSSEPHPSVDTISPAVVCKHGFSIRPPSNPNKSRSSSTLAHSLRKKLSPEQRARRSAPSLVSVEPQLPRDVTRDLTPRQVSACSRLTTDSGYGDDARTGVSSGSRRTEDEIISFISEKSSADKVDTVMVADRPTTPNLLIEGTPFIAQIKTPRLTPKHTTLPGSVDSHNILERAPLPPIHSRPHRANSVIAREKSAVEMQVEQSFDVIERSASRGGVAFDILMDVNIEKKKALKPIEFNAEELSEKKHGKKIKSTSKLTKEGIEAKLAAAESRRKKREQDIIDNLIEQREIEEKKMKVKFERNQKATERREATLGERMRTRSINREAVLLEKVNQAHRVQERVENARESRKSINQSIESETSSNS